MNGVSSMFVSAEGQSYPMEGLVLNPSKPEVMRSYVTFLSSCGWLHSGNAPWVDYTKFVNGYGIGVCDLARLQSTDLQSWPRRGTATLNIRWSTPSEQALSIIVYSVSVSKYALA